MAVEKPSFVESVTPINTPRETFNKLRSSKKARENLDWMLERRSLALDGTPPQGHGWFRVSGWLDDGRSDEIVNMLDVLFALDWQKATGRFTSRKTTVCLDIVVNLQGNPEQTARYIRKVAERVLSVWPSQESLALYQGPYRPARLVQMKA